ncbi:MAG: hypothetical protein A2017_21845 [Lentisphaerae bacterium GWF2_44_16]|nr:MAG: hypothetical protein A2017_21845 [Lentisphaerae bacterium GWF2_44_16]
MNKLKLFMSEISVFTLLELLIVISIIAILAAILLPSLQSARNLAKEIKCLNNEKQIYGFASFYTQDYNDYLLPNRGCIPSSFGSNIGMPFPQLLQDVGIAPQGTFLDNNAPVQGKMYHCPMEPLSAVSPYTGVQWRGTNYGLNQYICGQFYYMDTGFTYPFLKIIKISQTSKRLYGGDNTGNSYPRIDSTSGLPMRHSGKSCTFYVDGHAGTVKIIPAYSSYEWGVSSYWSN